MIISGLLTLSSLQTKTRYYCKHVDPDEVAHKDLHVCYLCFSSFDRNL